MTEGKVAQFRGHTTLVLNKAGGPLGDRAEPLLDRGLHDSRARHLDGFGASRGKR